MVTYVKLPKLSWTMEEGTIVNWYKKEGETVEKGEPICEAETEKTIDEIEAPEAGILRKIIFPAGSIVPVNQTIAVITEPGEFLPDLDKLIESSKKAIVKPEAVEVTIEKPKVIIEKKRLKISPVARKLAEEYEIDLQHVKGSGPGGRIVRIDVLKMVEETKSQSSDLLAVKQAKVIPLTGMRKVIADRLALSMTTALHVPITIEVDMTEAVKLLEESRFEIAKGTDVHLSYTDIIVKAVAKALEKHPIMNSIIEDEQIRILEAINIGVAVALEDGLIVPVVHNANKKSVTEIAKTIKELVKKARQGRLLTKEASGGTFTISNLGMFGIDFFAPIINPPESAILGIGRIVKKPIVIDDQVIIRLTMTLCLVFDHRVVDGAVAARFLHTTKEILENPRILVATGFEDP